MHALVTGGAVALYDMIRELEAAFGIRAKIDRLPEQPGDVPQTWAIIEKARDLLACAPRASFSEGVRRFAEWYKSQPREGQSQAGRPS